MINYYRSAKPSEVVFTEENFFAKQVPFFEHITILAAIPFMAREDLHPRAYFHIDETTMTSVKEKYDTVNFFQYWLLLKNNELSKLDDLQAEFGSANSTHNLRTVWWN